jgi:hypothetical protein
MPQSKRERFTTASFTHRLAALLSRAISQVQRSWMLCMFLTAKQDFFRPAEGRTKMEPRGDLGVYFVRNPDEVGDPPTSHFLYDPLSGLVNQSKVRMSEHEFLSAELW